MQTREVVNYCRFLLGACREELAVPWTTTGERGAMDLSPPGTRGARGSGAAKRRPIKKPGTIRSGGGKILTTGEAGAMDVSPPGT